MAATTDHFSSGAPDAAQHGCCEPGAHPTLHGVVFAILFPDLPDSIDGLKLAGAVRDRWPPIKIVATSGLVDVGEKDLPEGGRFLAKPYRSEQLTDVLRELIGGSEV